MTDYNFTESAENIMKQYYMPYLPMSRLGRLVDIRDYKALKNGKNVNDSAFASFENRFYLILRLSYEFAVYRNEVPGVTPRNISFDFGVLDAYYRDRLERYLEGFTDLDEITGKEYTIDSFFVDGSITSKETFKKIMLKDLNNDVSLLSKTGKMLKDVLGLRNDSFIADRFASMFTGALKTQTIKASDYAARLFVQNDPAEHKKGEKPSPRKLAEEWVETLLALGNAPKKDPKNKPNYSSFQLKKFIEIYNSSIKNGSSLLEIYDAQTRKITCYRGYISERIKTLFNQLDSKFKSDAAYLSLKDTVNGLLASDKDDDREKDLIKFGFEVYPSIKAAFEAYEKKEGHNLVIDKFVMTGNGNDGLFMQLEKRDILKSCEFVSYRINDLLCRRPAVDNDSKLANAEEAFLNEFMKYLKLLPIDAYNTDSTLFIKYMKQICKRDKSKEKAYERSKLKLDNYVKRDKSRTSVKFRDESFKFLKDFTECFASLEPNSGLAADIKSILTEIADLYSGRKDPYSELIFYIVNNRTEYIFSDTVMRENLREFLYDTCFALRAKTTVPQSKGASDDDYNTEIALWLIDELFCKALEISDCDYKSSEEIVYRWCLIHNRPLREAKECIRTLRNSKTQFSGMSSIYTIDSKTNLGSLSEFKSPKELCAHLCSVYANNTGMRNNDNGRTTALRFYRYYLNRVSVGIIDEPHTDLTKLVTEKYQIMNKAAVSECRNFYKKMLETVRKMTGEFSDKQPHFLSDIRFDSQIITSSFLGQNGIVRDILAAFPNEFSAFSKGNADQICSQIKKIINDEITETIHPVINCLKDKDKSNYESIPNSFFMINPERVSRKDLIEVYTIYYIKYLQNDLEFGKTADVTSVSVDSLESLEEFRKSLDDLLILCGYPRFSSRNSFDNYIMAMMYFTITEQ